MTTPKQSYPIPTVVALVWNLDGILFVHRVDPDLADTDSHKDVWYFPGGKVEDGEQPTTALARELKEEFGVEAAVSTLIPMIATHTFTRTDNSTFSVVLIPYIVQIEGTLTNLDPKHAGWDWVRLADLKKFVATHNISRGALPILHHLELLR